MQCSIGIHTRFVLRNLLRSPGRERTEHRAWNAGARGRDGLDLYSPGSIDPYLDEAIEQAQRAGIIIYSIYAPGGGHFGHSSWRLDWEQNDLSRVSDEDGGEAYDLGVVGAPSFKPYFDDISRRLSHQYLLTFLAKPETKAGMRSIKLSTEVPNAELVGAARAYVPASTSQ